MNNFDKKNQVAKYYARFGSWAGYNLIMGRSQHAGYWTKSTKTEKEAQRNYLDKLVEILAVSKTDRVLDAGSGQGYAARHLAKVTGAEVTGITITPREVRISEKLSEKLEKHPTFVLGDYSSTDFPDGHFDVVYTTETLSHAVNLEQTFSEFYRIMKPGGRLVILDYEIDTSNLNSEQESIFEFLQTHAGGYGLYNQNPGQIADTLTKTGFIETSEEDWSQNTKKTYDRLRNIARPFSWIKPSSKLAPYFINAVMASYFYSNLYEAGIFRYLVYQSKKP